MYLGQPDDQTTLDQSSSAPNQSVDSSSLLSQEPDLIAQVQAKLAEAAAAAASASHDPVGDAARGATATLDRAVQAWAGPQYAEVQAGTRDQAKWTAYGQELLTRAAEVLKDNQSWYVQWTAVINAAGNTAQAIADFVTSHLAEWQKKLEEEKTAYAALLQQKDLIDRLRAAPVAAGESMSPELTALLHGPAADEWDSSVALIGKVLDAVDEVLQKLAAGARAEFTGGDVALGAIPVYVGVGLTIAGVAAALAWCAHELIKDSAQAAHVLAQDTEHLAETLHNAGLSGKDLGDALRDNNPLNAFTRAEQALERFAKHGLELAVGAAAVGAAVYYHKEIAEAWRNAVAKYGRKPNPRRGRRRNPGVPWWAWLLGGGVIAGGAYLAMRKKPVPTTSGGLSLPESQLANNPHAIMTNPDGSVLLDDGTVIPAGGK
jgi:hypothetical protein